MRKSPAYYIAPSAISITPNANESANDLAVHVARGARIKVFSRGIPELGFEGGQGQSWAFSGRNRRLADASPYTIYARLSKTDKSVGYLVFAPKVRSGNAWKDKYPYVTMDGLAEGTAGRDTAGYWYVRLGDVTEPVAGQRSLSLDTGILGTEEFNALWSLNQDELPIRVVIGCTIDDEDAGPTPYVPWGKALQLHATLVEGWDADASERFDHWTIARNTGAGTDESWPDDVRGEAFAASGDITLPHHRDADDFSGAVSSVFTVTAWALREEEEGNENSQSGEAPAEYVELAHASVTIMAETAERYELVLSSSVVSYSPDEDAYSPAEGIAVSVRVIDQRNDVRTLSGSGVAEAGISAYYAVVGMDSWTALPFSDGDVATAVLPVTAFAAQQDVIIRLLNVGGIELTRATVAFVRDGDSIRITGSSVAYAASDDGLNHPGDSSDPVADPDDVAVPDDIVAQTSQVLSSFDGIVPVPSGSATFAYLSKVMYEASRQYNDGESAYGLPVLYRKANFPNVIEYYGTDTATSQAFRAMTGWLVALVLTEIRPDKRGALMRSGYNLGPSKDTYIYRYEFRSDPNVARLVASAIYAAMRGLLKPSLSTMRTELGAPDFTYTVAAVDAATYDDYRSAYYVDISGFMPTAPGPYLTGYTDRSAVGGAPYDGDDLADHNLQTDLDVYNIVVDRYNLDNAAYRQQTVQAIANIEHTAVHLFGDNVRTENYAFHPTFGTDTIGKRIATDGATASAVAKLGHLGSRNRNWLLEGSHYGRRRPGQGATDGSVKAGAQGVLMNYEIENGDGRGTGYATEAEYIAGTTASIRANSYPSGHSAYAFAGAMFLMELLPGKADLILRAANQYATDRQITRYHWLSDTITGRLAGAAIAPVERASADYASLLSAASIELGAGTVQSAWKATIAETGIRPGMYLWTRRTTSYSDGRVPTVEYSVARWGIDGDGIAEIDSYYLGTDDPGLDITQETDAFPMPGTPGWDSASPKARWFGTFSAMASANGGVGAMQGWYIWEKTIVRYDLADSADGTERTAPDLVSYQCSRIGMDGQIGQEEYYMLAESDDFNTVFGSATPTYAKCGIRWYNQSNPAAANYRLSDTTPNINTSMWSAVMPAYDPTKPRKKYLWNFEQRAAGDGTEYATRPICIGNHARGITGVIELYALSASQTPVSASRPIPSDINSKNTFGVIPTSGFSDKQVWGDERYDRAPTEELPYQWNWTRTLYSAADDSGLTYEDHYHVSAVRGSRGEDGSGVEYIYYLGTTNHASGITPAPSTPASSGTGTVDGQSRYYAKDLDDWVPAGWTDNPQSIDYDHQVEWVSERRTKNTGTNGRHEWGAFSAPKVWSRWGKNGQDGDGVEYVYVRTTTNVAPTVGSGSSDSSGRTYLDDEYLPKATGGSLGSSGVQCTDDPSGVDASHPFEWVAKRTKGAPDAQTGKREWQRYSGTMALWANYNKATDTPVSAFQWNQSESVAPSPLPNGASLGSWSPTAPNRPGNGYYLWMTQSVRHTAQDGTVTYDAWSAAVRISGSNGTSGEDLKEREWIYKRQDTNPGRPASSGSGTVDGQSAAYSGTLDDWVPSGWTDNPQGVTNDNKTEWASWRDYDKTAKKWNAFSAPIIWSHYGERGIDGDGIQYVFKRFTTEQTSLSAPTRPSAPNEGGEWIPSGWTDDPQGVTETYKYEYVSTIKRVNGVWGQFETPALWAKWSADGKDGESSWVADLDNEMDSVSCDGNGRPAKQQYVTAKATLFFGQAESSYSIAVARNGSTILSNRSSSGSASSGGVTVSYNSSSNTVTIGYSTSAVISGKDEFIITLTAASDPSVSRERKLIVQAMSGDIYNILPAVSQIRAGRTSDGGYSPGTYTLKCGYVKRMINGETTVVEHANMRIDDKYYIYFRKRSRVSGAYSGTYYRYTYWWDGSGSDDAGLTDITLNTYDAVEFILCTATATSFNAADIDRYTVIDQEVVPVVSDGTDGKVWPYLASHKVYWALSGSGTTAPTSWTESQLTPTAETGKKYLWRKDVWTYDAPDHGRNLMRGTGDLYTGTGTWASGTVRKSGSGSIARDTSQSLPITGVASAIKITSDSSANCGFAQDGVSMKAGKITMSCWIKGESGTTVILQPAWNNSHSPGQKGYTCNGDWQMMTHTVSVNEASYNIGYVYVTKANQSIYVTGLKVEYGESYTDWCLSPEDLSREEVSVAAVYGDSPWQADLDNEMDSVACDDRSRVVAQQSVSTNIRLFCGDTMKSFKIISVSPSSKTGVTISYPTSSVTSAKLTITYGTTATITGKDDFAITIQATEDSSVTKTLHFTVNGVIGDVYNVKPGEKEIVASFDGSTYTVNGSTTVKMACGFTKNVKGTVTTTNNSSDGVADGKYYIFYRWRKRSNQVWAMWNGSAVVYEGNYTPMYTRFKGNETSLDINTYDAFEFVLTAEGAAFTGGFAIDDIKGIDYETVYVVSNGKPGEDGDDGYGIALVLKRDVYTEAQWNNWTARGWDYYTKIDGDDDFLKCRVGDYFMTTGTTTDSGKHHTAVWKCTAVTSSRIDGTIVSHISDGTNGKDGAQGSYEVKQYARSAYATSTNGSTPPADRTSDGDWETTPPIPNTSRPFIWQRTRLYNPATGNYATSWAYVRLTGEPGDSAAAGKNGLWYAYAGVWGTDVTSVTNTSTQGWYVKYGNDFWMNVQGSGANTSTPSSSNTTWEKMKSEFKYYIANAYFGDYAHFGSFIINGDWMISQCGKLKYYTSSAQTLTVTSYNCNTKVGSGAPYSYFKNSDPTGKDTPITGAESSWRFIPSFAVDGKTGKVYMSNSDVKGIVRASLFYAQPKSISGTVTLDLENDPHSLYIITAGAEITLPSASSYAGLKLQFLLAQPKTRIFYTAKLKSSSNYWIPGTDQATEGTVYEMQMGEFVTVVSDGTRWYIISSRSA